MKNRIAYIDKMRGLAILLVLMNHVIGFIFNVYDPKILSWWRVNQLFFLPLFFYVSGWLFVRHFESIKNWSDVWSFLKGKLITFVVCPLFILFLYVRCDITTFQCALWNENKYGYWFTISLFLIFVIALSLKVLFGSKDRGPEKNADYTKIWLFSISIGLIAYLWGIVRYSHWGSILNYSVLNLIGFSKLSFLLYFMFGIFARQNSLEMEDTKFKLSIIALFLFLSIIFLNIENQFISILSGFAISFVGIMFVKILLVESESIPECYRWFGRYLTLLGKYSLEIYFIHFFFLQIGPCFFQTYIHDGISTCLLVFTSFIWSFFLCNICILIASLIGRIGTLNYYLFGKTIKE